MRRSQRNRHARGAVELIEEATHLLRTAPMSVLAGYYVGSVPFILGLLFFWGDMSAGAFAYQHLAGAALGMTLLFLWMKWWHAYFARGLRAFLGGEPPPEWNFARCRRVFVTQAVLQPLGLFVLPVALSLLFPFGIAYAFFQNLTILDEDESGRLRHLVARASRQARLWSGQNHVMLLVLVLFAFCVFIGLAALCYVIPALGKMLLGLENVFTRSGSNLINSTFYAVIFSLAYLSLDPIVKAIYTLRCFYGESLKSGDDLKAEVKRLTLQPAALGLIIVLTCFASFTVRAQQAAPVVATSPNQSGIAPSELDHSIEEVIRKNKYAWRTPRDKAVADAENANDGPVTRFLKKTVKWLGDVVKGTIDWFSDVWNKIFGNRRARVPTGGSFLSGEILQRILIGVLILGAGVGLFFLLYRVWRNKQRQPEIIQTEAIQPVPDVADENVSAEQLPEDGWTRLARELLERGELRLALRAFYLASLAHLAQRNLISLAKFKSNREYERELQRRGHSFPTLLSMFGENLMMFDRTWYGRYETDRDAVLHFANNVEKIKAGG